MRALRLLWASNAPWAPTGYGTQTRLMLRHLVADGHDVAVASNWGLEAGIINDPESGVTVYPRGVDGYGADVLYAISLLHQADWTISLYDVWVYLGEPRFQKMRFASWTPVDRHPVPPEVRKWAGEHPTIAMSRYGQAALEREGVTAYYAPHSLDLDVWKPTESDFRKRLDIPADAFLVTINAANKDAITRKGWGPMMYALGIFLERHPDTFIYLHTEISKVHGGIDLALLMASVKIPPERVRIADDVGYRLGVIPEQNLVEAYSASDVLLATSLGEGFGIPVIEAQACGIPVIVTDFSAQPELVGAGWTVPFTPQWDPGQGAYLGNPSIPAIVGRLEEARDARGTLREQAVAKAAEYETGKVYAECWRPILADLEAKLKPPTRQERRARARAK